MKKIITIIGARPQIIKASAISRAIKTRYANEIEEIIVHTGQHYDENMSEIFFTEMDIPKPKYNLQVGSASHGVQTAEIIKGIEELCTEEKVDGVLIYGDTNSTLAGAIAASKIEIPVIHVEAGLRSYNKQMPEEINRILSDHVSTLLFCPTQTAVDNLQKEGFSVDKTKKASKDHPHVYMCGDIMFDNSLFFSMKSDTQSSILEELELEKNKYILCTIHRNANTDDKQNINAIFRALESIQRDHDLTIVLPLHPRTKKMMEELLKPELVKAIMENPNIKIIPPAGFLDIIALEKHARLMVTDSGGLQKEAFFFKKPCVILRPQTEWVEIVANGNAILADADYDRILKATHELLLKNDFTYPPLFGDGKASEFIVGKIIEQI
ncbi:MAG: UDP-N-acetylglucosamine 2-epimerase (non-hydrolyzing) [Crocinitomicaceae bacterium]|jgi:UDP-GlcNAc3NAcA epimerase|nr:UDP-N-acetylglucosamine 2-epimerase (non-hydrolyzing) [Crocinitomicaceae bacterium]